MNMKKKRLLFSSVFVLSLVMTIFSIFKFGSLNKSSASVYKNVDSIQIEKGLHDVLNNGEKMYVARSSFYDYYADSEIGNSQVPHPISDAIDYSKNTMDKFNNKLLEIMKYGDPNESPAKYPLYQGRQGQNFKDSTIFSFNNNSVNEKSNYWLGANSNQIGAYATQGLVDSKLTYDSDGESHITQSNPDNGKSAYLPYFDKEFLTKNIHDNSRVTLGHVVEDVPFPFRQYEENGVTYYEFDSLKDTIRIKELNPKDKVEYFGPENTKEQIIDPHGNPGFFPFNKKGESKSKKLNYAYGVKIEVPFLMTKDGKVSGKDMVYSFTGDDDVWVYIDGELVLDMGGGHPKTSGTINFATSTAVVSGVKNNNVAFASRMMCGYGTGVVNKPNLDLVNVPAVYNNYKTSFSESLQESLKNTNKVHTLTLYYMERGMDVANMKMKFNLVEPTKLNITNYTNTSSVGNTFKTEVDRVVSNEEFLYDVEDEEDNKFNIVKLKGGESAILVNEFDEGDLILLQQKGLSDGNREMTNLYNTAWSLQDENEKNGYGSGLVVNDPRVEEKRILMKNKSGAGVPVLSVYYANSPYTGKFLVSNSVSKEYMDKNPDYASEEMQYIIRYENVFGGDSKETVYVGEYVLIAADGKEIVQNTINGVIKLKPGEKAKIVGIPVKTKFKAELVLKDNQSIEKVITTDNLHYSSLTSMAIGEITTTPNVVEFVVAPSKSNENVGPTDDGNKGNGNAEPTDDGNKGNGNVEPTDDGNKGNGNVEPTDDGNKGNGNAEPTDDGNKGNGNTEPTDDGNKGNENVGPTDDENKGSGNSEPTDTGSETDVTNKGDGTRPNTEKDKIESEVGLTPEIAFDPNDGINRENFTNQQIEDIVGEKIPNTVKPEQLEKTLIEKLDDAVKTGDNSKINYWLVVMVISIIIMIAATLVVFMPFLKEMKSKKLK